MGDLSLGDDNWTDESTTLTVASENGTIDKDFLLWVRPGALDPNIRHVDGIRAEAFAEGIALRAEAHTFDADGNFPPSGTGVHGSGDTGVRGIGTQAGVFGRSDAGIGVLAIGGVGLEARGDSGPAAKFSAFPIEKGTVPTPQIEITPQAMRQTAERVPSQPTEAVPEELRLPAYADPGNLLMTENDGVATLWLCVKGPERVEGVDLTAQWCEVLLGSAISGTAE